MAVKAIVQLHERSTTTALEADLQLRELGLDAQTNSLTVSSELDATKWHIITKEHTAPSLDNALTLSSTLTVVGASTLAALSATTGSFSSTLVVVGVSKFGTGTITFTSKNLTVIGASFDSTSVQFENTDVNTVANGRAFNFGITDVSSTNGRFDLTQPGERTVLSVFSNGNVGVGSTTDGGEKFQITGTLRVTGASTLAALSATTGTFSGDLTLSTLSSGRIPVVSTSGLITQDNLYWDATNDRLGIGSAASSPSYTLDVLKSTTGSAVVARLGNAESTDPASSARLEISTAGAGAGDPFLLFYNNVTNWSVGLDNSDSDALVFTPGATLGATTNAIKVTTSGIVTFPMTGGWLDVAGEIYSKAFIADTTSTAVAGGMTLSSTAGLILRAYTGSSYDFGIYSVSGGGDGFPILTVATGTFNLTAHSNLAVSGDLSVAGIIAATDSVSVGAGGSDWTNEVSINVASKTAAELTPTADNQTYKITNPTSGQVIFVTNVHASYSVRVDLESGAGTNIQYITAGKSCYMRYNGTRWYSTY